MINLFTCSDDTIAEFGREIWLNSRKYSGSFEDAAHYCAEAIYNGVCSDDGQPLFALVRFYRLIPYAEIPNDLRDLVAKQDGLNWALMGTFGIESAWRDRRLSRQHKVVAHNSSPMFEAAYQKIDRNSHVPIGTEDQLIFQRGGILPYFYVPKALDSAVVPSQKDFVVRYGIKSVIGIGCKFISQTSFLGLAFSTTAITEHEAAKFVTMTPYISTLLADYDRTAQIWSQN